MLNPHFNQTTFESEQDLVQDLIDESIQIYGHEVYYVPRTAVNLDTFLGEDPLNEFTEAYPIEMYLKTVESFQGQSEFIGKFGLHIQDQATFVVSQRRFNTSVILPAADVDTTILRPNEHDLIFVEMTPDNRYLFEIRFVENKEQLFELGKLYTYELRCEMFNYTHETVRTRIPEIDGAATAQAYTIELSMVAGGAGTYESGETVYQGDSLDDASATGEVVSWNSPVLSVQNITGTFANNTAVIGASSFATWTTESLPQRDPSVKDPIADNELLQADIAGVVVNRGARPIDD
jgi:hypothetical protein